MTHLSAARMNYWETGGKASYSPRGGAAAKSE